MKWFYSIPFIVLLAQCRTVPEGGSNAVNPTPGTSGQMQQIINVSAYDPKERQREGRGFTQHDVSALAANGSRGLIARAGKG